MSEQGVLRPSITAAGHAIVCERTHYRIGYENSMGMTVAHADVWKWTPEIAKQFLHDVDTLIEMRQSPVYIAAAYHDEQLHHFAEFCGFDQVVDGLNIAGVLYRLYARMPQRELEAA